MEVDECRRPEPQCSSTVSIDNNNDTSTTTVVTDKKMPPFVNHDSGIILKEKHFLILERLASMEELRVKSLQRTENDLSKEEKYDVLKELLESQPLQFLLRFGGHLMEPEFESFSEFKDKDFQLYLKRLKVDLGKRSITAKNRRYAALQKLVETTDYFSEEEMQRRNPILYDQLVGRFHSKEEREIFLARSCALAAKSSNTPLTDLLMAHIQRTGSGESCRRNDQDQQKTAEEDAEAEYLDDSDDEVMETTTANNQGPYSEQSEEIDDDEKELLKEEFYTTMYRHFLEGKDVDFDYSTVDGNDEYEVGENDVQDAEDKYFDDEEPELITSENSSESSSGFNPPVRCKDIERKIENLQVEASDEKPNSDLMDDEEDELDKYMLSIENELSHGSKNSQDGDESESTEKLELLKNNDTCSECSQSKCNSKTCAKNPSSMFEGVKDRSISRTNGNKVKGKKMRQINFGNRNSSSSKRSRSLPSKNIVTPEWIDYGSSDALEISGHNGSGDSANDDGNATSRSSSKGFVWKSLYKQLEDINGPSDIRPPIVD